MAHQPSKPEIVYSCYYEVSRGGEQFIQDHVFSYHISGTLVVNDGNKEHVFKEGDFRFVKRNQLAKFLKQPPPGGEFRTLSVILDQETLKSLSIEHGYTADKTHTSPNFVVLKPDPLYKSFMDSILPYGNLSPDANKALLSLKVKEAVLLLLRNEPSLKEILFDFTVPGKIDLEAFMLQHYQFNVGLNRFAYLTGRSLATFKRDFEKTFHTSPGNWLLQKRLEEAYYLIKQKGNKPSDVYLEVGFEDLSHFSYAFKNAYGISPSKI
ncbi:helix-turn-helix domain-containing protein [Niastella populi]|uniref:AraC family transcriptional regulator n=1 Tax=Niastella populi TaxID=550983 RepID=A0A1V9F0Z1_9BACT|nr:AraC family transcriptional regulator [Niastella populi]OQP51924.1 AraC family transcriptional regulator [Niastella populi]